MEQETAPAIFIDPNSSAAAKEALTNLTTLVTETPADVLTITKAEGDPGQEDDRRRTIAAMIGAAFEHTRGGLDIDYDGTTWRQARSQPTYQAAVRDRKALESQHDEDGLKENRHQLSMLMLGTYAARVLQQQQQAASHGEANSSSAA